MKKLKIKEDNILLVSLLMIFITMLVIFSVIWIYDLCLIILYHKIIVELLIGISVNILLLYIIIKNIEFK
jgi:hypothetical protein